MNPILKNLQASNNWKSISEIKKGWSGDKKYLVTSRDNIKFLLRLSEYGKFEKKKEEFNRMAKLSEKGFLMSSPVSINVIESCKKKLVGSLFKWVEGIEAEKKIPGLSPKEQYRFGLKAGRILKKIHELKPPRKIISWEKRFNQKIDKSIRLNEMCRTKCPGADIIIKYIDSNRELLSKRKQTFHHGDYHIGNMIISNDVIGIIDFNRFDYGDPWEEFNRITWCARRSKAFASGRIDGYFENNVPDKFFKLMALYIGVTQLGSITWALQYRKQQTEIALRQTKNVLKWFDNYKTYIPDWYKSNCKAYI